MKKLILSFSVIVMSIFYAISQKISGGAYMAMANSAATTAPVTSPSISQPAIQTQAPIQTTTTRSNTDTEGITTVVTPPKPTTTKPTVTTTHTTTTTTPKGQYADGTYTGSSADAYYGTVQVQATVTGGKLSSVAFLQYPNDRGNSVRINSRAMPILKTEAITAQSANVHTVSGASDTSMAFRQSLQSALSQARA
jgi:uncharacterized protein with FMN-binding domain